MIRFPQLRFLQKFILIPLRSMPKLLTLIGREIFLFFSFLLSYLYRKVLGFPHFLITHYLLLVARLSDLKFFLTAKLIWSRGRLFSRFSHLGILALALVTLTFGGFLSGTKIVRRAEGFSATDYLSTSDVLKSYVSPETFLGDRPRHEPLEYTVAGGDTLSSIGELFRVSVDAIRYANNLSDEDLIKLGQKLIIPPVEGVIYTVKKGDTLSAIARRFKVADQAIGEFNYIFEDKDLKIGQKLVIPQAEIPEIPKTFAPPPLASSFRVSPVPLTAYKEEGRLGPIPEATGAFGWPIKTRRLTQYFTRYHLGIDVDGSAGDPVYAADGGVILRSGWWLGGFGNAVKIDHGNDYTSSYAHLSRISVSVGQRVEKGQEIGEVGSTGRSTGAHLHFVVQKAGQYLNPLNVF